MAAKKKKPYKKRDFKFYRAREDLFFYQEYNLGPSIADCPRILVPFLAREGPIAHTHYVGPKEGYITTHLLRCNKGKLEDLLRENGENLRIRDVRDGNNGALVIAKKGNLFTKRKETIDQIGIRSDEGVDKEFGIDSNHVDLGELTGIFVRSIRHDIFEFCKGKPAKNSPQVLGDHFKVVGVVHSDPKFTIVTPGNYDVVKEAKGRFEKYLGACVLDIGFDLSRGCVANTTLGGLWLRDGTCGYCYAHQNRPCFADTLYDINYELLYASILERIKETKIQDKKVINFRIGQTTEANVPPAMKKWPGFRDNLKITLETLAEFGKERPINVAMPTKIPVFDEELIQHYRTLNVAVLVSVGPPELERGMNAHGYDTQKRLQVGLELENAGVNVAPYIIVDVTRPFSDIYGGASAAIEYWHDKSNIGKIQFLDARVTSKKNAMIIGGMRWEDLKRDPKRDCGQTSFVSTSGCGRFYLTGQNYLAAKDTHPDWLNLVGDNKGLTRICSTHAKEKLCGLCFMD